MTMLIPDKKRTASIILSRMTPNKDGEMEEETKEVKEDGRSDAEIGLIAAAERLSAAIKEEDSASMIQAIRNINELLRMEQESEEME